MSRSVALRHFSADDFSHPPWRTFVKGGGGLEFSGDALRLVNTDTTAAHYTDAQLDDYQSLARRDFLWRPPLRLTIRARFSHPAGQLSGTAGFGFWNDPFMMTGWRWPTAPRAIWFFFASSPSNMKLARHIPGHGWKAATIDALRWSFFALLPTAPLAIPLMNIGPLYRTLWPMAQKAINVSESIVPVDMTAWHTYVIDWRKDYADFFVDGHPALTGAVSPRGPLGFVLWLDNQAMVVTPWGHFKYSLLDAPGRQWLAVSHLSIEPG